MYFEKRCYVHAVFENKIPGCLNKIILIEMEFIVPDILTTYPKCSLYETVFFINCQWVEEPHVFKTDISRCWRQTVNNVFECYNPRGIKNLTWHYLAFRCLHVPKVKKEGTLNSHCSNTFKALSIAFPTANKQLPNSLE